MCKRFQYCLGKKGLLLFVFFYALFGIAEGQNDSANAVIDTTSADYWRQVGFEARINNDMNLSLQSYLKILNMDSLDWDANLAVARLYFLKEDYQNALKYYEMIYMNDSTDVEALWGIGKCYFRIGKFDEAIRYFNDASMHLKDYIPVLLDLSNALTNNNQLRDAIKIYEHIILLDSTNIEAYSGIGKLNYWLGRPSTSVKYYKKALMLDPLNIELSGQYLKVKDELAFLLNYQFHFINESEPIALGSDTNAYNINAFVQKINVSKRINNVLMINFGTLIDRSYREYVWQDDTDRWYDFSYLRGMLLLPNNKITAYLGYSFSDSLFAAYGMSWELSGKIKKLKVSNNITFGYEYYYYWNQVGHDFVTDHFKLEYKNLSFEGVYRYANVKEMYLSDLDTIDRNQSQLYSLSLKYSFFKNPKISVGLHHQYRDYQHISPFYWSPQERKLNGINAGLNWKINKKLYFYCYGNIGKDSYDVSYWEAAAEIGYNLKSFNFSAGAYRYYNPWYESFNSYFSVSRKFTTK